MAFYLGNQGLEFIEVHLVFFDEARDVACVRIVVETRHRVGNHTVGEVLFTHDSMVAVCVGELFAGDVAFFFEKKLITGLSLVPAAYVAAQVVYLLIISRLQAM